MFGKSTDAFFFDSFVKHAKETLAAVRVLQTMFDEPHRAKELAKQVVDHERAGDTIIHDVVKLLHDTWITPFDRADIHALISSMDDVLDQIEEAAERFALFEIEETKPEAKATVDLLAAACEAIARASELLPTVKKSPELLAIVGQISKAESDADAHYRQGLADIYKPGSDPLLAMKWRDVFNALENGMDRCEDVANVFEGIVLEYA